MVKSSNKCTTTLKGICCCMLLSVTPILVSKHLIAPLGYKLLLGSSAIYFIIIYYNIDVNWLTIYRCGTKKIKIYCLLVSFSLSIFVVI